MLQGHVKPDKQRLPKKEAETFKNIVKFYETKQYKKGLKAADTVLKKFPEHGETLAMKALARAGVLSSEVSRNQNTLFGTRRGSPH